MQEEWSHEIQLALRAVLFKLSIWDHNASYGAALQGLHYTDSRSKGPVYAAPTKWQKTVYGLLTVGGRYAWDKWESWLIGREGGYEEVGDHALQPSSQPTDRDKAVTRSPDDVSINGPRFHVTLDRCVCVLLGVLGEWPIPNPSRPYPSHPPDSAIRAGQSRGVVRISESATGLARLHRISSLPTASRRDQSLEAMGVSRVAQSRHRTQV